MIPRSPESSPTLQKDIPALWKIALGTCFILLALFSARKMESYDLGTHLKAGSWIVQNHAVPSKDTFTYTQNNQDYLDSNWLYQVILYSLQTAGGYASLTLMNSLLILLVFWVLAWRLKLAGSPPGGICLCLLGAILVMERRFYVRPEVLSWLFLGLTLLILEYRDRNRNFLYLLPFIQLAWVNTEGLFILGWAPLLFHGIGGYLHHHKLDKPLLRAALFSLVADLANPYFLKGALFPLTLGARLLDANPHKQNIAELSSPFKSLSYLRLHQDSSLHLFLFFFLSASLLVLLLLTWKKRRFPEAALSVTFALLAFSAIRNIPLFILVAVPYLPAFVRDLFPARADRWLRHQLVPLFFSIFALALTARVATNAYYITDRRVDRTGLGLGENCLPVRAVEFLRDHSLNGRLLNTLNCGGWVDWRAPQPSFIDGRSEVVRNDFYEAYLESGQPGGLARLVSFYQPQLILMDYIPSGTWADQLKETPGWRLIYLDSLSALYAAPGYAPELSAVDFSTLPPAYGYPYLPDPEIVNVLSQETPHPWVHWFHGFYRPQRYPLGLSNLGLFALKYGQYPAAQMLFLGCLQEAGGGFGEIYFNLGLSSLRMGNYNLGRLCLQEALQADPANAEARKILSHFSQ